MSYTFDGRGVNGADKYASRLATLTDEGHKQNVGKLLASAPELFAHVKDYLALMQYHYRAESMSGGDPVIERVKKLIRDIEKD